MVPTLERLTAHSVPTDILTVRMRYHHLLYRSQTERCATIEQLATGAESDFSPLVRDVDPLVDHIVKAPDLLESALGRTR